MIVTVTPNPSIDRTIRVERLVRGSLNRASVASSEAAGKGLNVSRALAIAGQETLAVLPLPRETATTYLELLADAVPIAPVLVDGSIRVNISLVEADGTVTKVNEPGPALDGSDVDTLLSAVAAATSATWVVGCGSLPPGVSADFYARLAQFGVGGRRVAVDTSGEALRACVGSGVALLKPNLVELEELSGCRLATLGETVDAAAGLVGAGVDAVVVSLGRDGAVYVDRSGAVHAEASIDDAVNPVGAGDAFLAGYLAAGGGPGALRQAVEWSVAAVRSPGTRMRALTNSDREAVTVHDHLDRARILTS